MIKLGILWLCCWMAVSCVSPPAISSTTVVVWLTPGTNGAMCSIAGKSLSLGQFREILKGGGPARINPLVVYAAPKVTTVDTKAFMMVASECGITNLVLIPERVPNRDKNIIWIDEQELAKDIQLRTRLSTVPPSAGASGGQ